MGGREDDGDKSVEYVTRARKAMFAFQRPIRPCDALRGPDLNTGIGEAMWVRRIWKMQGHIEPISRL